MRRGQAKQTLIAGLLLLHFTVLALAALPQSRFIEKLYPWYSWYIKWTGQGQNWAMYQYPAHSNGELELIARLPDGREVRPWGLAKDMRARQLYFLEGLALRGEEKHVGQEFLQVLRERWPSEPKPSSLTLRRTNVMIHDFRNVPEKGLFTGERPTQQIVRTW